MDHYVDTEHYFQFAQRAGDVLTDNRVTRYPLHPMRLADHYGIKVISYARFAPLTGNPPEALRAISEDGFSIFKDGCPVVAYNTEVQSKGRRRWTLLHEISHILLGHIGSSRSRLDALSKERRKWLESDADDFAACLIAPLGVAHLCNVQSETEMKTIFGLSMAAAGYFLTDLNQLRASGRIRDLVFPELLSLCLPFVAERLTLQYRLNSGILHPAPCLDISCDNSYDQ